VVSKHPKVTVYIPKEILQALDDWKQIYDIDSRSEAIVTILEDYLEGMHLVQYEEPQESGAPPRTRLSKVLDEIYELKERVVALEESIGAAP
jgi:metal-responsive CopG/Arc/MetJ family transcriptional regulator